jgi:hypothetical protein
MTRSIIARLRCDQAEATQEYDQIRLQAVYSSAPGTPNQQWSKWTPSGSLQLAISNPPARGMFEVGEEYDVIVRPARYRADEIEHYRLEAERAARAAADKPDDGGLQSWAASARKTYERAASRPA